MQPTDRPEFFRVLAGLAAIKPGAGTLTPEALDLWWGALRSWPLAEFKAAASHLASAHEFMPSPYHFDQLRKAGRPTAAEAWNLALSSCSSCRVGANYGPGGTSGNPLVDRVVQSLGGYAVIAMCSTDKLHFLERRFTEHFEDLQDAEDVRQAVPQIAARAPNHARLSGPAPLTAALVDLTRAFP